MPAAAVKRGIQALSGITGRKAYVGGFNIFLYKKNYIFVFNKKIIKLEFVRGKRNFLRSSEMRRYKKEDQKRKHFTRTVYFTDTEIRKLR